MCLSSNAAGGSASALTSAIATGARRVSKVSLLGDAACGMAASIDGWMLGCSIGAGGVLSGTTVVAGVGAASGTLTGADAGAETLTEAACSTGPVTGSATATCRIVMVAAG